MTVPVIRTEAVTIAYPGGPDVIKDVDLDVGTGELVALVGRSGIGKTTLLRTLVGLIEPTSGAIRLADGVRRTARSLGFVPQHFGLLPWLSAEQNVAIPLWPLKLSAAARRSRCEEALELVGGISFRHRPVCHLSGGMQQRVALARAMVGEPQALLLDEPFSGIDWWTRRDLQENILRLQARQGLAVLVVTHDLDEALRMADRIVVLEGEPARITRSIPIPSSRENPGRARTLEALRGTILGSPGE